MHNALFPIFPHSKNATWYSFFQQYYTEKYFVSDKYPSKLIKGKASQTTNNYVLATVFLLIIQKVKWTKESKESRVLLHCLSLENVSFIVQGVPTSLEQAKRNVLKLKNVLEQSYEVFDKMYSAPKNCFLSLFCELQN